MKLTDQLADKAAQFPECSYGASKVTLLLHNGQEIHDVIIGGGGVIVKVAGITIDSEKELPFSIKEIKDIRSEI